MATNEANAIWSAFIRYSKSRDEALIAQYSRDQIESTIAQFTNKVDRNTTAYKAMEMRIERLKENDAERKDSKKLLSGIILGILIGIFVKIIGDYLWNWLTG